MNAAEMRVVMVTNRIARFDCEYRQTVLNTCACGGHGYGGNVRSGWHMETRAEYEARMTSLNESNAEGEKR